MRCGPGRTSRPARTNPPGTARIHGRAGRISFGHALIREFCYGQSARRRAQRHRRAAAWIEPIAGNGPPPGRDPRRPLRRRARTRPGRRGPPARGAGRQGSPPPDARRGPGHGHRRRRGERHYAQALAMTGPATRNTRNCGAPPRGPATAGPAPRGGGRIRAGDRGIAPAPDADVRRAADGVQSAGLDAPAPARWPADSTDA